MHDRIDFHPGRWLRQAFALGCILLSLPLAAAGSGGMTDDEIRTLAIETLAGEISAAPDTISVIHVSAINWPNSALGCPKPGMVYTQALVPGHVVLLKQGTSEYRVHMGNGRAIVCDLKKIPLDVTQTIDKYVEDAARKDLAGRLAVPEEQIEVVDSSQQTWPDENLGCGEAPKVIKKPVRGYVVHLKYDGRLFEYRSNRGRVRPCPDIAKE